ncbi:DUF58 domain-containing protein [Arthrobacter sp. ISL-30]|uniref:DUF58 domain-containing protein n=1 Tax=Arthrobacter sp. ISL-30 TaxID=2819109 RepID=UPI001BE904F7|nr:DUF58 domain-containing protein [Arthrobacter sp. ISL-30]MBT2514040.1 DUF58 domain-containing protein [Arthrobacter sp. ISL-30]
MALLDLLPKHVFTSRGWGLLASGGVSLLAAQIMGRRDLLTLAVLLLALPLVSLAGTRLLKPRFQVYREFNPASVETSSTTMVRLAVARTGVGSGLVVMEEQLPPRFGQSPAFRFPARSASSGTSRYEYHLRSTKRGQFRIGPVTAEFSDPFGLSLHRHAIDDGDILTVTPAAVELPATGLAGARGNDGVTATRIRANPSDDDVMTREYRHGDPMRRVHWPATARHGLLMVRQEESVTTPEATIILDQRFSAFASGMASASASASHDDGFRLSTSNNFEWAVTAAISISAHLAEHNYSLRLLDSAGDPAFCRSPSAPDPEAEEFSGAAGLQSIAEGLAAIQLTAPHHARHSEPRQNEPRQNEYGTEAAGHHGADPIPFDDHLMDKLAAHRLRGPLLALLGNISPAEAKALAPAAAYGANAFAIAVTDHLHNSEEAVEALRLGGWRAVTVTARTPLAAAWSAFDQGQILIAAASAMDVRRGAAVPR